GRELPRFEDGLRQVGFAVRTIAAAGEDEVAGRIRALVTEAAAFVAAVGDDGTFHGAVNGWIRNDRPVDPDAVLALVAAGSGADVVRTFGLSQDAGEAAERVAVGNVYSVDVVKAAVTGDRGDEQVRYVLNHLQVGMGA